MVSDKVYKLCHASETVSSELAGNPSTSPGEIVEKLYPGHKQSESNLQPDFKRPIPSAEDLERAQQCGQWGPSQPSKLFLQAYADALSCLDNDPTSGMVSPPLMGSHGTMPLTIIAPLADIIRHVANLIVRAEREVFFITCSWAPSVAQRLVKDALVELSKRAGARKQRVVVKMMYDKAGPKSFADSHQVQKAEAYTGKAIQLPSPSEIPHLDLEVISLHKPLLGTLHAKFVVVDRKVAAVMSNNMEDNDNMEMMTHVEGPIVDSIYDTALITWDKQLNPPLPSRQAPAVQGGLPTSSSEPLFTDRGEAYGQQQIVEAGESELMPELMPGTTHYDVDLAGEFKRMQSCYSTKPHETRLEAANRQLNLACKNKIEPDAPEIPDGQEFTPYISTSTPFAIPMAMVSRPPFGPMTHHNFGVPQNQAWLSCIRNAERSIFIQTPDLNAVPLIPALAAALERGITVTYYVCFGYNDAGEIIPGQGGTNDQAAQRLVSMLSPEAHERLHICYYVGKDQSHPIHQSFKQRSCHIKLLIADEHVAIQGSGNQDTQSWCHSQEINIMIDSAEVCEKWREGIDRNQNTARFGISAKDGVWRDANGQPGEGSMGNPGTTMGLFKGVKGMLKKRRATSPVFADDGCLRGKIWDPAVALRQWRGRASDSQWYENRHASCYEESRRTLQHGSAAYYELSLSEISLPENHEGCGVARSVYEPSVSVHTEDTRNKLSTPSALPRKH
ncbi:hypothetical protein MRB53_038251 [Persea americana]|nr:hypothetical protein MRB53_038251 [Persea americana]